MTAMAGYQAILNQNESTPTSTGRLSRGFRSCAASSSRTSTRTGRPWEVKGVPCSMVVLDGTGGTNDAYVCEIPGGPQDQAAKHMYEEMVYVTKGYGATTVWQRDGRSTPSVATGSMFAIP